jgi:hypothetical protein
MERESHFVLFNDYVGVNTSHKGKLQLGWSANAQEVISNYGSEETARRRHNAYCSLNAVWGENTGGYDWRGKWHAWEGLQTHTKL